MKRGSALKVFGRVGTDGIYVQCSQYPYLVVALFVPQDDARRRGAQGGQKFGREHRVRLCGCGARRSQQRCT